MCSPFRGCLQQQQAASPPAALPPPLQGELLLLSFSVSIQLLSGRPHTGQMWQWVPQTPFWVSQRLSRRTPARSRWIWALEHTETTVVSPLYFPPFLKLNWALWNKDWTKSELHSVNLISCAFPFLFTLLLRYAPIGGEGDFCKEAAKLAFGDNSPVVKEGLNVTVQGISGTGSLRIGAEFISKHFPLNKWVITIII